MGKYSYLKKLKYKFDNLMSKGTVAIMGALAVVSAVSILIVSTFVWMMKASSDTGFLKLLWMCLMRTMDAGAVGGDEGSFLFLLCMLVITFVGIFVFSILIGLLTTGIESKMNSLRKGKSLVIEENHTVILGWNEMIFTVLSELIAANENQKKPCIVILGDIDKVEMEDEIRRRIPYKYNTRIVCRQGSPEDIDDLSIVNIQYSKSIILLERSDINVIKTIVAIMNGGNERKNPYHIVTQLMEEQNLEIGKIISKNQVEFLLTEKIISRIMVQTCLQPGLSIVLSDLFDFGGDEIYFKEEKNIIGNTFEQIQLMYDKSIIIGIFSENGVVLNPPKDTVICSGDQIIAITEDDDTTVLSSIDDYSINDSAINNIYVSKAPQLKVLILGWNAVALKVITEMNSMVNPGTILTIAAKHNDLDDIIKQSCSELQNLIIDCLEVDTNDRTVLDELSLKGYDRVIILAYENMDIQKADGITLVSLLHLRDISEKKNIKFSIVSEMLDIRNRALAEAAKVNDFIVSDRLVSLILTQLSENKNLGPVFEDLLDADGSELYIKNVCNYIKLGKPVNFYTIVKAASSRGEVAIGYKIAGEERESDKNYGVYINPKKQTYIEFNENDSIIVLAEN